jgi:protein-tyrosine phosphatase
MADCTLIEPGLFLGGICVAAPAGVDAVLSVTPTPERFRVEVFEWQPISSGVAPTVAWLRRQVLLIDRWRREGKTVFVHCDAGMDRSAMVVVGYLMWRQGMLRDEAVEKVRRKRGVVRISEGFLELLGEWEREVRRDQSRMREH